MMRITIAMSMLAALFRVCWCFLRVVGVLDLSTREYGTCGTRIGLALGAAPERFWTAMMGRMMADGKMAVGGTQKP